LRSPFARVILVALIIGAAPIPAAAQAADWSTYLGDSSHSSVSSDATFTSSNLADVVPDWTFKEAPTNGQPAPSFEATPVVVGNRVYVGSESGNFFALDLATGTVIWQRFLGFVPALTCQYPKGITATATVAPDPATGALTVYVAGGDGNLYALSADTGATVWQSTIAAPSSTQNDYYDWSSPTVSNGKIYVGMSSECDNPFPRGGLKEFSQEDGTLLATAWFMPQGEGGAGIWTSAAVAPSGDVYVTTGSTYKPPYDQGESYSIIRLDGNSLAELDRWTVPQSQRGNDADWGASPAIFTINQSGTQTEAVGAMDKNGFFYAFPTDDLHDGPIWATKVATTQGFNLAAADWNGTDLYVATAGTKIDGVAYAGSIAELDPNTGRILWQTGLPGEIVGTPILNGAGILAAPAWSAAPNGTYLVDAQTGEVLQTLSDQKTPQFAQPVFAGDKLLLATANVGLDAYEVAPQVFADDFDSQAVSWTKVVNTGTTNDGYEGAAAQVISSGSPAYATETLTGSTTDMTLDVRLNIQQQGSTAVALASLLDHNGTYAIGAQLGSSGNLVIRDQFAGKSYGSKIVPSPGWHSLRVHVLEDGTQSQVITYWDGQKVSSLSRVLTLGTSPLQAVSIGDTAKKRTFDVLFDDVVARSP
jgi:outer membrane protein assembly factor BamB